MTCVLWATDIAVQSRDGARVPAPQMATYNHKEMAEAPSRWMIR